MTLLTIHLIDMNVYRLKEPEEGNSAMHHLQGSKSDAPVAHPCGIVVSYSRPVLNSQNGS